MKKIKTLLILGATLLLAFAGQSQSITYRFNNYMVVDGGANPDTLIFDIEAKSNVTTTYTTGFNMRINFNSAVFGASAVPVVVQPLVLTLPTGYNLNVPVSTVNATSFASSFRGNRLALPHNGTYLIAYLSNLDDEYLGVARYKMLITGSGNCGIALATANMNTGNSYVLVNGATTAINYTPVTAANNLLNLPSGITSTDLMFTEFGDPAVGSTEFVEIYNYGAVGVDFGLYPWYLSIGGSTSVQLTGTIAAGGKYVVGNNSTDFAPNLVSAIVGTNGANDFELSVYGDYATGTTIDFYDADVAGFGFTGKHAVRHYNVVLPNPAPNLSEWVISTANNTDMTPGSHRSTLNWDGVPSSDWRLKANWAEGFIPDAGHNVSITSVGTAPIISNGDNAYCHDLAIVSGSLTIESLPGGDGSLITYGTVTGTASVQRYLGANRYWYVSKPVTSATANVFLHMWLFTYTGGAWSPFIYDVNSALNQMQGYAVWTSSTNSYHPDVPPIGSTTRAYSGTLNSGDISTSLATGYNFVGNPYPSAADWEASGWTKTNLATNTCYFWYNSANYASYTVGGGSTNGGTRYIPAAQGFFVQASAAGTLGVSNAVRTHSTQSFWKSDENMLNRLSLTVSNGETNDETVIYFNDNATTQLDYNYDAMKLMAPAAPQAYTMMETDKMAINTLNNTTETPVVTMGVNAPEAGEYTITASNLESFDVSIPIYLEDLETGGKISLREMSSYSFTAGEGTSERFKVHFAAYQGIGDQPSTNINGIYAVNNNIYVDFNGVRGEIAIYNILGQEVSRSIAANGLNMVSVPQGNAVYIVKVISDNTTVTKKVFVK